jgi:hypothetical protein
MIVDVKTDPWDHSAAYLGHQSGLCNHDNVQPTPQCSMPRVNSCIASTVKCTATKVPQVTGFIGTQTFAGKVLAGTTGTVNVSQCLEHLLDLANDWPDWKARSYGIASACNYSDPTSCVNTMDTTYNYPLWYGPWAAAMEVDPTQDAGNGVDLSKYTWTDAENMVVHAMADGEWGGAWCSVFN